MMDIIPITDTDEPVVQRLTQEEAWQQSNALEDTPPTMKEYVQTLKNAIPDEMIIDINNNAQQMSMGIADYMYNACQVYNSQQGL